MIVKMGPPSSPLWVEATSDNINFIQTRIKNELAAGKIKRAHPSSMVERGEKSHRGKINGLSRNYSGKRAGSFRFSYKNPHTGRKVQCSYKAESAAVAAGHASKIIKSLPIDDDHSEAEAEQSEAEADIVEEDDE